MEDLLQIYDKVIFPILQAGVLLAVTLALRWIGAKYKINFSQAQEDMVRQLALDAVAFTEEQTYKNLKIGMKLSPGGKMETALEFANKHAPKLDPDKVRDYIEAQLAQTKGVGATGERTVR